MEKVFNDKLGFSLVDGVVDAISAIKYDEDGIQITCEPVVEKKVHSKAGTHYFNLKTNFHVADTAENSTVSLLVPILEVPDKTALGYVYHDNYTQVLDKYNRARGWVFTQDKSGNSKTILISNNFGQKLRIMQENSGAFSVMYARTKTLEDKQNGNTTKVDLGVFIRAVCDTNLDGILAKFPKENYVIQNIFAKAMHRSMEACVSETASAVLGSKGMPLSPIYQKLALRKRLFSGAWVNLGFDYSHAFKLLQSFSARAVGKILAEDVEVGGETFEKGTTLTAAILDKIDECGGDTLRVKFNEKIYTLHKFYKEENANTLSEDMLLTVLDIISNNAMGYDYFGSEYDVANRVLVSVEYIVGDCAVSNVQKCVDYIVQQLNTKDVLSLPVGFDPGLSTDLAMKQVFNVDNIANQQADMTNILSIEAQNNKVTTTNGTSSVSADSVQIQDTQDGRFDMFDVPESTKIGRVHRKCVLSKSDEAGEILCPYNVVKNGEVEEEVVYLSAAEENNKYIADWNETFKDENGNKKDFVLARFNGNIVTVDVDSVGYRKCSAYEDMSIAHACVPFPGHSNGKRITMACNEYRQAVVTCKHERPYVNAGGESMIDSACVTTKEILEFNGIERKSAIKCLGMTDGVQKRTYKFMLLDDSHAVIRYTVDHNMIGSSNNIFSFELKLTDDLVYGEDDIVFYTNAYDANESEVFVHGEMGTVAPDKKIFKTGLALANNINVVIKTCDGSTIDDACVISDRLIADDQLTHVFISKVTASVSGDNQMFGCLTADDKMTEAGVPEVGTWLCVGDPVISKIYINDAGGRSNHFVRLGLGREGQVVGYNFYSKNNSEDCVDVYVACRSAVEQGDKFAGRHGNKTVVAKILPAELMPYNPKTGFVADICINPLGIPSRQNISQLLDIPLSYCLKQEGTKCVVAPYNNDDNDFVEAKLKEHGVDEEYFIDGRTGFYFDRPCFYGVMSLLKLHHIVRSKEHAVGFDASVAPITLQPNKGAKMNGGQVIGEMEAWCLCSVGAANLVQEFYSFRSDDVLEKERARKELEYGNTLQNIMAENHNDMALQAFYLTLGISIEVEKGNVIAKPVTDKIIRGLAPVPITSKNQLHSEVVFGKNDNVLDKDRNRNVWSYLELNTEIVSPVYMYNGVLDGMLLPDKVRTERVMNGEQYVYYPNVNRMADDKYTGVISAEEFMTLSEEERADYSTGMDALVYFLKHYNGNAGINMEKASAKRIAGIRSFYKYSNLSDLVISTFPVIPELYRFNLDKGGGRPITSDFDWYYRSILAAANNAKERPAVDSSQKVFDAINAFLGLSKTKQSKRTLVAYFAGKGAKGHGALRSEQQSKRIVCSGRTTIIPTADMKMDMRHVGIPYASAVRIWYSVLAGYLNEHVIESGARVNWTGVLTALAAGDRRQFARKLSEVKATLKLEEDAWSQFDRIVHKVIEGDVDAGLAPQVVVAGRQPTLHRYGIRAYYPVVVRGRALQIHPLVCGGYNADFDGDTMWYAAVLTEEAKAEAMSLMSAAQDIINPKDSNLIINHSQDVLLGIFYATMLPHNASSIEVDVNSVVRCQNLEELRGLVETRALDLHDVVTVKCGSRRYLSTAGRILFNELLPDGFMSKTFTNPLGVTGVDAGGYCDLAYDATVTGGKIKNGSFRSGGPTCVALSKINKEIFQKCGEESLDYFQKIMEFGFRYADRSGVSLGFRDLNLKFDTGELLKESDEIKTQLELDYNDGLLTEEDKVEAVNKLFTDDSDPEGPLVRMKNKIDESIAPDNNVNIIMNSGARGNATQLMHMCGMLGVLQKSSSELMETPVIRNYTQGLSAFDVHIASYSTRTGLASTQLETGDAGYATRQSVCIMSGLQIVEEDCGNTEPLNITWGQVKEQSCKFMPKTAWIGREVISTGNAIKDAEICRRFEIESLPHVLTQQDIAMCQMNDVGFNHLDFGDGSYQFKLDELVGKRIEGDEDAMKYCKNFLQNGCLTEKCVKILLRHNVRQVECDDGIYQLCYYLDPSLRSMLLNRVVTGEYCKDPLLWNIVDTEENCSKYLDESGKIVKVDAADILCTTQNLKSVQLKISNEDVLDIIEDGTVNTADVRTLLTCKSKGGVCAKCYGVKFTKRALPKVKEYVGYESAHALSEDVTQLTISLINKGGAGSSVASGVDIYRSLLNNSLPKTGEAAVVAPRSGYVNLFAKGDRYRITISPENESCQMCQECLGGSGLRCTKSHKRKSCMGTKLPAVLRDNVLYEDGEYVKAGDLLVADDGMRFSATKQGISNDSCLVSPNAPVGSAVTGEVGGWTWHDCNQVETLQQVRQMTAILNYYRTFDLNDIHPNARHFEVLSHIQTNYVAVDGVVTDFNSRKSDSVEAVLPKKGELTMRNSGLLTAAVFEDVVRTMGNAVVTGYVSSAKENNSPISLLANGADLRKGKLKPFTKHNYATRAEQVLRDKAPYEVISKEAPVSVAPIDMSAFDVFNNLSAANVFGSKDVSRESASKDAVNEQVEDEPVVGMVNAGLDLDAFEAGAEVVEEAEPEIAEEEPFEESFEKPEEASEEVSEGAYEESKEFDPSMLEVSDIFAVGASDDFDDEDEPEEEASTFANGFANASGSSIFEAGTSKVGASEVSDDLDDLF